MVLCLVLRYLTELELIFNFFALFSGHSLGKESRQQAGKNDEHYENEGDGKERETVSLLF